MEEMQPGQIITPRGSDEPNEPNGAPNPDRGPTGPPEPTPSPVPAPEPVNDANVQFQAPLTQPYAAPEEELTSWQFHQESDTPDPQLPIDDTITWTAAEFINNEKTPLWYLALIGISVVAASAVYLIFRDMTSTVVIILAALAFAGFASHKPRTQQYGLSRHGLQIGLKTYGFQDFKTFSVVEEGATASIVFMPLKRFMPPITIFVTPDVEERVVTYLSAFLPLEQRRVDAIDSLLRRIRF